MSKHNAGKKRHAGSPSPAVLEAGIGASGRLAADRSGSTSGPRPAGLPGARSSPTHEEIATRAYELWQARGRPAGDGLEDWFEAERQLRGDTAIDLGSPSTASIATAGPDGPTGSDPGSGRAPGRGNPRAGRQV